MEIKGLIPPTHTDSERLDALLSQPTAVVLEGNDGRIEFRSTRVTDAPVFISCATLPLKTLLDVLVDHRPSNVWDDHLHFVTDGIRSSL